MYRTSQFKRLPNISANISRSAARAPGGEKALRTISSLFFDGIQHSNYYNLQYTIATMVNIIKTIRNIQSVISVSQTINPITPIIIAVIAIAAINFARSITIYILQSKLYHLYSHKIIVQVSFICFLIHYISYSFRTPLSKFRNTFYQATEFQLASSFSTSSYKSGSFSSPGIWRGSGPWPPALEFSLGISGSGPKSSLTTRLSILW